MKDKQQKKEKIKTYDVPVTGLELHQELEVTKQELRQEIKLVKLELKQEMSDLRQEVKQEIRQEFSKFTLEVCKQIEKINSSFESRIKESEQEHINQYHPVKVCDSKLNI